MKKWKPNLNTDEYFRITKILGLETKKQDKCTPFLPFLYEILNNRKGNKSILKKSMLANLPQTV